MRRKLISDALSKRYGELCGVRILNLRPETFGEMSPFVSRLRDKLYGASAAGLKDSMSVWNAPHDWMESDGDCLASLQHLSLDEPLQLRTGQYPPLTSFLQSFGESRLDADRRFQLLKDRYACPLNYTLPSEGEVRERVLTSLMVQDRARIEKNSVQAIMSDDLLIKLNLTAVYASLMIDLRFLDALNYYYELLPDMWRPRGRHDWLLASYLGLYARALAVWI